MQIFTSLYPVLDKIFKHLEDDGIDVSELFLDHVCYRTKTITQYEETKKVFGEYGSIIKEKILGGRPIATYKLFTPIEYQGRLIPCVEIPAPKNGSLYQAGWEHAEFVTKENLSDWIARYPHIRWKTDGMGKDVNPEVAIMYDGCSVKFHNYPLEYVVTDRIIQPSQVDYSCQNFFVMLNLFQHLPFPRSGNKFRMTGRMERFVPRDERTWVFW